MILNVNYEVSHVGHAPSLGASDVDMSDDYDRLLLPRAPGGGGEDATRDAVTANRAALMGRGLHSSTSQPNFSRVCHNKTPYTP
jgi:hypothetical protein